MIAVTDHVESERYPAMLCYFWKANFNILDIGLSCISKTAKIYYEFIKGSFPKLSLACMIDKEKYHMGGSTKSQKAGRLKRLEAKIVKKPASYRDYVET